MVNEIKMVAILWLLMGAAVCQSELAFVAGDQLTPADVDAAIAWQVPAAYVLRSVEPVGRSPGSVYTAFVRVALAAAARRHGIARTPDLAALARDPLVYIVFWKLPRGPANITLLENVRPRVEIVPKGGHIGEGANPILPMQDGSFAKELDPNLDANSVEVIVAFDRAELQPDHDILFKKSTRIGEHNFGVLVRSPLRLQDIQEWR